jgi:HAMP domain-containing protein
MTRFRFIGSFVRLVVDLAILALLYGIMTNVIGDRLSKQLDNVDITFEEVEAGSYQHVVPIQQAEFKK